MIFRRVLTTAGVATVILSLLALAIIITRGVLKPQTPVPSKAEEGWKPYEDTDSKIIYGEDSSCWKVMTKSASGVTLPARGGSYHQSVTKSRAQPNCGNPEDHWASLDTTGASVKFDKFKVGYGVWRYGGKVEVSADDDSLSFFDSYSGARGDQIATQEWTSAALSCGEHKIKLQVVTGNQSALPTLDLDYIDVHPCTSSLGAVECQKCEGLTGASCSVGLKCLKIANPGPDQGGICVKTDDSSVCGRCNDNSVCIPPLVCAQD